jgi:hypothetical protein
MAKFSFDPHADDEDTAVDAPSLARVYSPQEKALRDNFVREYCIDYDENAAARRIGYNAGVSKEYAKRLMGEPYVSRQIKRQEVSTGGPIDGPPKTPEEELVEFQKRIIAGLVREANYRGAGSSQAARVAALAKLASLHGMDPTIKNSQQLLDKNGNGLDGVMVIPGVMTPEQWEAAAEAQQNALTSANPGAISTPVAIH